MTENIAPPDQVYVMFQAKREDGASILGWRWRHIATCLAREQARDWALERGPRDGITLHAVFAIGPYGTIEHVWNDVCKDTDPDAYALRAIPWSVPTIEAWRMFQSAANLVVVSTFDDCQPDNHWRDDKTFNPHVICTDDVCGGRCGRPYAASTPE